MQPRFDRARRPAAKTKNKTFQSRNSKNCPRKRSHRKVHAHPSERFPSRPLPGCANHPRSPAASHIALCVIRLNAQNLYGFLMVFCLAVMQGRNEFRSGRTKAFRSILPIAFNCLRRFSSINALCGRTSNELRSSLLDGCAESMLDAQNRW